MSPDKALICTVLASFDLDPEDNPKIVDTFLALGFKDLATFRVYLAKSGRENEIKQALINVLGKHCTGIVLTTVQDIEGKGKERERSIDMVKEEEEEGKS